MLRYAPASMFRYVRSIFATSGLADGRQAVPVASAADGLRIALQVVGKGLPVALPAYTCDRVVAAALAAGCSPRFYDVDPSNGEPALEEIERLARHGAHTVVLTHLHGVLPRCRELIDQCRSRGMSVVEDRALVFLAGEIETTAADFAVYSFGRGKPLPLGGGGLLVGRDAGLTGAAIEAALAVPGVASGLHTLALGVLRDGVGALRISRWMRKPVDTEPVNDKLESLSPLSAARLTPVAAKCLASGVSCEWTEELASAMRSTLTTYRTAFAATMGDVEALGNRAPAGYIVPALAVRTTNRDDALNALRASRIDCPEYWRYCIGEAFSGKPYPGSRTLANSLLFLPLHGHVESRHAGLATSLLANHRPKAFT